MSHVGSKVPIKAAIAAASFTCRSTFAASSRATSSHRLPISTPITLLPSMPTSIMLVGSGPRTRLYPGVEPLLPFVFRTAETPAGLQISTVVKTFRDLEVPPVAAFLGRRRRHTIRDRHGPGRSRVCTAPLRCAPCCGAPGTRPPRRAQCASLIAPYETGGACHCAAAGAGSTKSLKRSRSTVF